jgi:L-methionine (R)-S-oxide reductase
MYLQNTPFAFIIEPQNLSVTCAKCYRYSRKVISMFQPVPLSNNKKENYETMLLMLQGLVQGEKNIYANLANASSLFSYFLQEINWVGFYIYDAIDNELVLGPFQGLPACIRIKPENGVCGAAYTMQTMLVVPNVHVFKNHIACDSSTNSEIVIPIMIDKKVWGLLDIDSPKFDRFDDVDEEFLQKAVLIVQKAIAASLHTKKKQ